jgi:hypothetical protein
MSGEISTLSRHYHYRAYQALSAKIAEELIPSVEIVEVRGRPPEVIVLRLAIPTIRYRAAHLRALALDGGVAACVGLRLVPISSSDVALSHEPVEVAIGVPTLDEPPRVRLAPKDWDIVNPHTLAGNVCVTDSWNPLMTIGADLIPALLNLLTLQQGSWSQDPRTHLNIAAGRFLATEVQRSGITLPLAPSVSGVEVQIASELKRRWEALRDQLDNAQGVA